MLPLNFDQLAHTDIQRLIDSEVAESLTLEYKEKLPSGQSEEKREFLYDVAAMANEAGGDIVYGIIDRRAGASNQATGIADRLAGMKIDTLQTEITRLSNYIRDGISPRIVGVRMQATLSPEGDTLVIRVPRSWNKPHMVIFGGADRFYGRSSTGKFPMNVEQIGRAFSEEQELAEKISHWREHRAELIEEKRGPVAVIGPVTMLFHVIPASAFFRQNLRTSWVVSDNDQLHLYVPHDRSNFRYNADGGLGLSGYGAESANGYTQLFRSDSIEYADSRCFRAVSNDGPKLILGQLLEREMVNCFSHALQFLRNRTEVEAVYVGFSLIGIKDKEFFTTPMNYHPTLQNPITDNVFTSPEVFVNINETEESPYPATLLPLVDTMWQVAGRKGSPFYLGDVWSPFRNY